MLNFIDFKKMLMANFKKLSIDTNDLIVLLAIHDLKQIKPTPLPADVIDFLGLDKEVVNKSYTDLLAGGYITVDADMLSVEGTFKNIKNIDLVNTCPTKLLEEAVIFVESQAKQKLTASQTEFVRTAISKYGLEEFKRIMSEPKCKGSADQMITFFINTVTPDVNKANVSRTKWVGN